MNNNQKRRLKNIFMEKLGVPDTPDELSQKNCAQWDSVSHLNIVAAVEAEFGVTFAPEEIAAMQNFAGFSAMLDGKLRE